MDWTTIGALIARHLLGSAGAWLAAHDYLGSYNADQFIGAGMLLCSVAWSIWQKQGHAQALAAEKAAADYWRKQKTAAPGAHP